jgi:hypothetical protein
MMSHYDSKHMRQLLDRMSLPSTFVRLRNLPVRGKPQESAAMLAAVRNHAKSRRQSSSLCCRCSIDRRICLRAIARKLISDHDTWRIAQAPQKPLEETCGGFRIALALDKNVEDIAILIDSPPKIMRLAADF